MPCCQNEWIRGTMLYRPDRPVTALYGSDLKPCSYISLSHSYTHTLSLHKVSVHSHTHFHIRDSIHHLEHFPFVLYCQVIENMNPCLKNFEILCLVVVLRYLAECFKQFALKKAIDIHRNLFQTSRFCSVCSF